MPKHRCAAGLPSSEPAIPYVVTRGAEESSALGAAASTSENGNEPQHHVGRLDVAVDDVPLVGVAERVEDMVNVLTNSRAILKISGPSDYRPLFRREGVNIISQQWQGYAAPR